MTLAIGSGGSALRALDAAVEQCVRGVRGGLGARAADIAFVFVSHHHGAGLRRVGKLVSAALGDVTVAGCTGAWTASDGREFEGSPGLSVLALACPGTRVRTVPFEGGDPMLRLEDPARASVLLFADPFSFHLEPWLVEFGEAHPGVPLMGGLAGGGQVPGQCLLLREDGAESDGALAVVLEGDVEVRPAVSQGCRPIGEPFVITRVDRHAILELKGQPAARVLIRALEALPEADREHFQRGAFLGRAVDARRPKFGAEDLLVRNLLGIDPERNAIVVGDPALRAGQTVHLMVRDGDSAGQDLDGVMGRAARALDGRARGAILATCAGRGRQMFGEADHDAGRIVAAFGGELPLAGFAANGEVGPIGGQPFLHGFTASVGLFSART